MSAADELEALRAGGGEAALALIDRTELPIYTRTDFPAAFAAARAVGLGFTPAERSFADVRGGVRAELERGARPPA